MTLRKSLTAWMMGGAVALAIAGSAIPASAETVLHLRMNGDIKEFDPIWTTNYTVRNAAYMVWDTLFSTDGNFEVQPQMVDTWTVSDDGKTYTMTLRDGLTVA